MKDNELRESLSMIGQGFSGLFKIGKPYAKKALILYSIPAIVCFVICFFISVNARMQVDKAGIDNMHLQQKADSLQIIVDHYKAVEKQREIEKEAVKVMPKVYPTYRKRPRVIKHENTRDSI